MSDATYDQTSEESTGSETDQSKSNSHKHDRRSQWIRALYMVVFMFVFGIMQTIVNVLAILIFVVKLLSGRDMSRGVALGKVLGDYSRQIVHFLTFNEEQLPWPFSELPDSEEQ